MSGLWSCNRLCSAETRVTSRDLPVSARRGGEGGVSARSHCLPVRSVSARPPPSWESALVCLSPPPPSLSAGFWKTAIAARTHCFVGGESRRQPTGLCSLWAGKQAPKTLPILGWMCFGRNPGLDLLFPTAWLSAVCHRQRWGGDRQRSTATHRRL